MKNEHIEIITLNQLLKKIDHLKGKRNICHIICSGWSLNRSISIIKENDFVIGFNNAALCGIKFDAYFVELGSYDFAELSFRQIQIVDYLLNNQECPIYFKNIWQKENSVEFILDYWGEKVVYVKDLLISCYSRNKIEETMRFFLAEDRTYLKQYASTSLTMIALAKLAGFHKIVMHGLDFGGNHFFDDDYFIDRTNLKPVILDYQRGARSHSTSTNIFGVGAKDVLPTLYNILKEDNVQLMSAIHISPSSELLPVYENH